MSPWVQVRRGGGETPEETPLVTIRPKGIAFNAAFVRSARLLAKKRVSAEADHDSFQIGFKFLDSPSVDDSYANSYALTRDGGGRGEGRSAQAGALLRIPWIAAVARIEDNRLRRFTPTWFPAKSLWVVSLCPAFETRVSAASEIPAGARGIYRYRRGGETVYVGRGLIRSRLNAPERSEWDFETIEYSLIPDQKLQAHWESFWLDAFVGKHGKLPIYNRIAGKSRRSGSEG